MEKIKIKQSIVVEQEFEVEFPIYRKFDLRGDSDNDSIIYSRITRNSDKMIETSIHIRRSGFEIEVDDNYHFDKSSSDYSLGLGEYKSSYAEYQKAKNKVKEIFEMI